MAWDNMLAVAVIAGLFGLAILIVLWPGEKHGRRLLRRWGLDQPSDGDVAEAVRYLKRRRFWYPWLFFLVPELTGALSPGEPDASSEWSSIVWTVLLGGLLGELLALRPVRNGHREAILVRRQVVDLVPLWALVLLGLAIAGGVVRYAVSEQWIALTVVVVCALVVGVIIAVAVLRPAAGDPVVDLVLRARSARVATGLAIAVPPSLPGAEVHTTPAALVLALSLAALLAVVGPSRRVAPTAR